MPRAGTNIFDDEEDYLTPGEREARAAEKRKEIHARRLTPDWFPRGPGPRPCLPRGFRAAVIGAGFAGLAAAWYLDACGAAVTVYEATLHVGGRVHTDTSFVPRKTVEAGAELIGENHPLWWILADRFRLRLQELTDDKDYERAGLDVRLRFGGHDLTPAEKTALKRSLKVHITAIGREARPISETEPWTAPNARLLDRMSVEDKLNVLLPPGPSHVRSWFEFTLPNDNCAPLARQSYLGLLAAVSAARMGSDDRGMLGYWMSTETHRCVGGNQQLAERIEQSLPDVRPATRVTDVVIEPSYIPPVRVIAETTTGSGVIRRDDDYHVAVLATPPTTWGGITFTPGFDQAARMIQQGPAVKFLSRYDTRFWEDPGVRLAPSAKWDELGSVWEGTDNQGLSPPFCLTVYSGGPFVLPAADYPKRLATLYPTGRPSGTMFVDWPATPFIRTGYAVPGLREVMTIAPVQLLPHRGRLYFAGEQTSSGFFGYMEGALQSGARAARDIVVRWARPCDGSILI
jgi:monoamine oxidase